MFSPPALRIARVEQTGSRSRTPYDRHRHNNDEPQPKAAGKTKSLHRRDSSAFWGGCVHDLSEPWRDRILLALMARSTRSRLLAPLALAAVIIATAAIVTSGTGEEQRTGVAPKKAGASSATRRRTYVVRSGDTLSSIALRLGVPVNDLVDLNPNADTFTLQPGQRLRLRRASS